MPSSLVVPSDQILFLVKLMVLVFLGVYVIFAIVIVRQVGLMTKTVKLGFEPFIKILALLHLIFALGVVCMAAIGL